MCAQISHGLAVSFLGETRATIVFFYERDKLGEMSEREKRFTHALSLSACKFQNILNLLAFLAPILSDKSEFG